MIWCSALSVPGCILMWPWLPVKVGLESFQEICPGTFLDRRANIWTKVLHLTKSWIPFGSTLSCIQQSIACTGCGCTNMIASKPYMGRDLILDLSIRPFAISQPWYLNRDISTEIYKLWYLNQDISTESIRSFYGMTTLNNEPWRNPFHTISLKLKPQLSGIFGQLDLNVMLEKSQIVQCTSWLI